MAAKKGKKSKGLERRRNAKSVLKLSRRAQTEVAKLLKRNHSGTITPMEMETRLEEVGGKLKEMILFMCKFLVVDSGRYFQDVPPRPVEAEERLLPVRLLGGRASCQIANYLTRRTFSTNPATLEVIRCFITSAHRSRMRSSSSAPTAGKSVARVDTGTDRGPTAVRVPIRRVEAR